MFNEKGSNKGSGTKKDSRSVILNWREGIQGKQSLLYGQWIILSDSCLSDSNWNRITCWISKPSKGQQLRRLSDRILFLKGLERTTLAFTAAIQLGFVPINRRCGRWPRHLGYSAPTNSIFKLRWIKERRGNRILGRSWKLWPGNYIYLLIAISLLGDSSRLIRENT